jgi:hypothetical protein
MTRKRFVKLLMSHGITRNDANEIAYSYNARNILYEQAYRTFLLTHSIKLNFKKLGDAFYMASVPIRQATVSFEKLKEALEKCSTMHIQF